MTREPQARNRETATQPLRRTLSSGPRLRGSTLSIQSQAARIERAFKVPNLKAVALVVNSPGGSAVQSALIAGRIRALAEEHELPVIAFAEDVAASGGYWLACAGDEIFVNEASIVGSIGVVSSGFGFQAELTVNLLNAGRTYTEIKLKSTHKTATSAFTARNFLSVAHTLLKVMRWRVRNFVTRR